MTMYICTYIYICIGNIIWICTGAGRERSLFKGSALSNESGTTHYVGYGWALEFS